MCLKKSEKWRISANNSYFELFLSYFITGLIKVFDSSILLSSAT